MPQTLAPMGGRLGVSWTSVVAFLAIAFGISWFAWAVIYVFHLPVWTYVFGSWGPGVAALLVRGPLRREGFGDSGLFRLGQGGVAAASYAVALFLIPLAALASTLFGLSFGAFDVHWDPFHAVLSPNLIVGLVSAQFGLGGLALSFVLIPLLPLLDLGEEIGWRDYLVPRLLPLGRVPSLVLTGVVWAVWHLPFNLLLGYNGGAQGFPLFALDIVLFGALLGYLRLRSGSVWPCAILHTAFNYQPSVLIAVTLVHPGFPAAGPEQAMAIMQYAVTMLAGAAAIVVALRSRQRAAR